MNIKVDLNWNYIQRIQLARPKLYVEELIAETQYYD